MNESPRLTEYAELHGCSCKVGQSELSDLLGDVGLDPGKDQDGLLFGIGEDASAMAVTDELALVSTIDYFTPIIDDPYDFGRIAACNAASDAFAKGATDRVNALCMLGIPRELRDVAGEILHGMVDAIEGMGGVLSGGHTILNPWPLAGAAVTALAPQDELITTRGAQPGDLLYLTKPLGTQPAMGAVREQDGEFAETVRNATARSIDEIAGEALAWMTTPNRAAAEAAREIEVTAATDITGFGLVGQAETVAQNAGCGIEIDRLPVIRGTTELSRLFGYGLEDGVSAETSGGLLLSVPPTWTDRAEAVFDRRSVFYRSVGKVTDDDGVTFADPTVEPIMQS